MLHTELIPSREPNSKRLMVVLHGLGDSMEGYRWMPQMMGLPWLNYLLVDAPDSYYGGYSWYDYENNPAPGVKRSKELLFKLLDDLPGKGFPAEQTTLFGFSQGCLMTVETGLRYPHRLAGLIGISGYLCDPELLIKELSPVAREQRVLMTHGTQDPLIPMVRVRAQVAMLKAANISVEWREFVKVHTIAGEEELSVIRKFVRDGYPS